MSEEKKTTHQPDSEKKTINKLMRDLGATRWDATPVDQNDFFLDKIPGESPLQQVLAWMRAHTIRRGRWKAYAVDEHGKELHIERLAADLGWKVQWTQEVWRRGEEYGLFRREEKSGRLYLCGKVIRLVNRLESNGSGKPNRCTTDSSPFVLPDYLERQTAKLKPEEKEDFKAQYRKIEKWSEVLERDAMAATRAIVDKEKDTLFQKWGLAKQQQPKRREPVKTLKVKLAKAGQLDLFAEPEPEAETVETEAETVETVVQQTVEPVAPNPLYKGNPAVVQRFETAVHQPKNKSQVAIPKGDKLAPADPSLKTLENTRERTITTGATEAEIVVVVQKLGVKKARAQQFLAECRHASPGCTLEDIVASMDAVEKTIDKHRYENWVPIVLDTASAKIAATKRLNEERRAANTVTCWSCKKPIYPEDARMRGAHQECLEVEEAKETAQGAGGND